MLDPHERIRLIREKSGLSQEEFGNKMGITITTQNHYEKGLRFPTMKYLLKLEELGFDAFFILTGEQNNHKLSSLEQHLLQLWANASTDIRHAALNVLATGQSPQVTNYIGHLTHSVITGDTCRSGMNHTNKENS